MGRLRKEGALSALLLCGWFDILFCRVHEVFLAVDVERVTFAIFADVSAAADMAFFANLLEDVEAGLFFFLCCHVYSPVLKLPFRACPRRARRKRGVKMKIGGNL